MLLPFCAPGCGPHPIYAMQGVPVHYAGSFEKCIRKHHVLGSATMIGSEDQYALLLTSSDRPRHVARADTYFRVASITKTATAVLAMRLIDEGKLDPDEPVLSYLPDAGSCSGLENVSLRHLLSHTSGLIDPPDLESCLETGVPFPSVTSGAKRLNPGDQFCYSNLGFGLIGCIFESVLNMPLGKIFQQHLFCPLNMNATMEGCQLPENQIMPVSRILPYREGGDLILTAQGRKPLTDPDPLRHYGHTAGSMYTDIASLHRLFDVLINNRQRFLSEKSIREMTSQHASYGRLSPGLAYGLGLLMIRDSSFSDGRILGHQGFAYGCADGAFWEENTGRLIITLNGGCSEARKGRLGSANADLIRWAFRKELPSW